MAVPAWWRTRVGFVPTSSTEIDPKGKLATDIQSQTLVIIAIAIAAALALGAKPVWR